MTAWRKASFPASARRADTAGTAQRVPNTTNIWFDHLEGEALVIALDLKGLALSGGSACTSGATGSIPCAGRDGCATGACGREPALQPGYRCDRADVDFALELVPAAVAHLRELSPFYQHPRRQSASAGSAM